MGNSLEEILIYPDIDAREVRRCNHADGHSTRPLTAIIAADNTSKINSKRLRKDNSQASHHWTNVQDTDVLFACTPATCAPLPLWPPQGLAAQPPTPCP